MNVTPKATINHYVGSIVGIRFHVIKFRNRTVHKTKSPRQGQRSEPQKIGSLSFRPLMSPAAASNIYDLDGVG